MRRNLSLALIIVLAAAILGACSAGAKSAEKLSTGAPQGARPAEAKAPASSPAPPNAGSGKESAPPAGEGTPVPLDRKIIKNASFDIKVKDGDAAVNKVTASVTAAGGYVQDVKQSGTRLQGRTINITVRVPVSSYDPLTNIIRELGEVTNQHQWTEDVTEQFVDLEERIKTKEAHLNQLQKLYAQGGSIKEMMELESEIARVTADLESMKGRIRVLSNRVDFSTLVVNLYEPNVPAPIAPPKTVWERMQRGFTQSWNGVVNFLSNLAVFTVSALPVLAFLAIVGGIVYVIVRFVLKRFPPKQ